MTRKLLLALSLFFAASSLRAALPVITIEQSTYAAYEGYAGNIIPLIRSGDKTVSCSVQYHVRIDTVIIDATASFAPNEVRHNVVFAVPSDHVYDNRPSSLKNYSFSISDPVGALIGSPNKALVELQEDEPIPTALFQNTSVAEGNSGTTPVQMTIVLSGPLRDPSVVYVYAVGGTASPGTDYEPVAFGAQVTFAALQTVGQFTIRVKGDLVSEPDETVVIGGAIGTFVPYPSALGTLTILNDDYLLTPDTQRIARGTVGSVSVTTSVATPATDRVVLSSSNPSVAAVPPFVDVPAGSLGKSFDVTGVSDGSAVITATWPPSRGGGTMTSRVEVFTATYYAFDNPTVSVQLGQTATAVMHFDPPPSEPLVLYLSQTNPSVTTVPPIFTIGTNGVGSFPLRGTAVGSTIITTPVPAAFGGSTAGFRFDVTLPTSFTIARLDSTSGPSTGGQLVKIFGGLSGRCTAMFDGVSGQNTTLAAATFLTTTTPPHDPGTVDVSVRCGSEMGTLPKAYTYTPVPLRITRLSPTIGPAGGGALVTATGDNLRRGRCSLWFGGVTATTIQNDQTTAMVVTAPPHDPGGVDVTMRCGSDVSTLIGAFLYTGSEVLAQLTGVYPPSAAPGDRIIVLGAGFRDDDALFFDGAAGLDVTSSSDQHYVTVPELPSGNATITLRDVAGHVVAGPSFRVLPAVTPQITSAPTHILTSSEFPIAGSGLRRSLSFLLGGTVLKQVSVVSTSAQLRLPDSIAPGTYTLTIANQNDTPRTIQVTDGISVTSVSIPCSSTEGGPMVTIKGNGFAEGAVVAVGAADSSDVTVVDAHTIIARVPPSSGLSSEAIIVTNPNGDSAQLSNAFRYRWPDPGCGTTRHRGASH
jgi:hypothetical protein